MNVQHWGTFLLILGLVQVVLAGFFLRRNKAGGRICSGTDKEERAEVENRFWIWVGRFGSFLCVAGVIIIVIVTKT